MRGDGLGPWMIEKLVICSNAGVCESNRSMTDY